jgi:hypothetical protein
VSARQEALDDLRELVDHAFQNPAQVLSPAAVRAVEALFTAVPEPGADLEAAHVLGLYHYLRYMVSAEDECHEDLVLVVRYLTPVCAMSPDTLPEPLRRFLSEQADDGSRADTHPVPITDRASALFTAYQRTGRWELLDQAVALFRTVLDIIPAGHPGRAGHLSNLGFALRVSFERTGQQETITEAAQVGRQAIEAMPVHYAGRATGLNNLVATLQVLFDRTDRQEVLMEAVSVGRQAVAATPTDHPHRAKHLNNLGLVLRASAERTGQQETLIEAVEVSRQAVEAASSNYTRLTQHGATAPHPDHAALALHYATTRLRTQNPHAPALWAAYTHTGI